MTRLVKVLLALALIYVGSYAAFRQTRIEIWERGQAGLRHFPHRRGFSLLPLAPADLRGRIDHGHALSYRSPSLNEGRPAARLCLQGRGTAGQGHLGLAEGRCEDALLRGRNQGCTGAGATVCMGPCRAA